MNLNKVIIISKKCTIKMPIYYKGLSQITALLNDKLFVSFFLVQMICDMCGILMTFLKIVLT